MILTCIIRKNNLSLSQVEAGGEQLPLIFYFVNRIGLDGKSAYDVAVAEGFAGNEAEWLVSLRQPAVDAAESALVQVAMSVEHADRATASATTATAAATTATMDAITAAQTAQDAATHALGVAEGLDGRIVATEHGVSTNAAVVSTQGERLATAEETLIGKTDKKVPSVAGNLAGLTSEGDLQDSGIAPESVARLDDKGELLPAQFNPLEGWQTGIDTAEGYFSSTAPGLLFGGDRSIEVFFTTGEDITSNQSVVTNNTHTAPVGTRITIANRVLTAAYKSSDYIVAQPNYLQPNTTYHVVLTPFKLYVNGVWAGNIIGGGSNEPIDYSLGSYPYTTAYPFKGTIHSSRLFNYALPEVEVLKLWNGGRPGEYMLPEKMKNTDRVVIPIPMSSGEWTDYANYNSGDGSNSITHTADKITFAFNSFVNESGDTRRPIIIGKQTRLYVNKVYRLSFKLNVISGAPKYRYIGGYISYMDVLHSTFRSGETIPQGQTDCEVLLQIIDPSSSRINACFLNDAQTQPYRVELSDMNLQEIGCVAEYLPCGLLTDKWRDTSGNGLNLAAGRTPRISYDTVPDLTEITVDTGVFYTNIAEGTASKSIAISDGYRIEAVSVSNLNQGSLTGVAASLNGAGIFTGQTITAASPSLIYSVSGLAYKKTGNTISVNATGNTTDGGIQVKVVCKWTGF